MPAESKKLENLSFTAWNIQNKIRGKGCTWFPPTVNELMRAVMRPRGAVSTCLTPRLSNRHWQRPLAALTHFLWSYTYTHRKINNSRPRRSEKHEEDRSRKKKQKINVQNQEERSFIKILSENVPLLQNWNFPVKVMSGCFTSSQIFAVGLK